MKRIRKKLRKRIILFPEFMPDDTLDFHLLGKLDIFAIEKYLTEFLEDSYVSGHKKVLVITGKGEIVRPSVQRMLQRHNLVSSFKRAGYFNGQEGAFEVHLSR